jgi:F0F1-type ATP synthase membrane subunit c/vacuolar-type H+-ATPase subunit K
MQNQTTSSEQTYRILMIIWCALFMTQFMFFVVVFFAKPELYQFDFTKPILGENAPLIMIFAVFAISNLVFSIFLAKKFIERAIEEQKISLIQTAMIIGCALSESISLIGIFLAFAFSYQYFFAWIVLGIIGMVLHFPQRDNIHKASFRSNS